MKNKIIDQLVNILDRGSVLSTPEDLVVYSFDGTFAEGNPGVIVLPQTTEQVSQIVQLASKTHLPVVPRGWDPGWLLVQFQSQREAL